MKYFPLKIAIFCLLFTPILYIATLYLSQNYLNVYYLQKIENIFIGDSSNILNGRVSIEEQITDNIDTFLANDKMVKYLGLSLKILVTTEKGKVIYPTFMIA
jgi:hypothetical protein